MRAIAFESFGGPDVLHAADLPRPRPEAGEVLIRVVAAGVNPVDWKIRDGLAEKYMPHRFPIVPGWDAAGVVEELGDGAGKFRKGDRVWTYARKPTVQWGCYAEYVTVPERSVGLMPASLLHEEAASIPLAALTAYQCLFGEPGVGDGSAVLVHAAAGGVGHFAVQLAKNAGAAVIGTAGPSNQGFLSELGVDRGVDYTREDFREAVKSYAPEGVDLVLDAVGKETRRNSYELLRPGGRLVTIVSGAPPKSETNRDDIRIGSLFVEPNADQLDLLAKMVERKKLRTHVEKIRPLSDAAEAQAISKAGHVRGKLVLAL